MRPWQARQRSFDATDSGRDGHTVTWHGRRATTVLCGVPPVSDTQDAGLIATSHAAGVTGQFSFTDLTISL